MRAWKSLCALLLLCVVFSPLARSYVGYISPHEDEAHFELMNDKDEALTCPNCHEFDPETTALLEHRFVVEVSPTCWGPEADPACHDATKKEGRSHPVDFLPEESSMAVTIPEALPLQGRWEDTMTCGTCHNPHGDFLSTDPVYAQQEPFTITPEGEVSYYQTYYLRVTDPAKGFAALCISCHEDY